MKFKQTSIRSLLVAVSSITASQAATVLYSENFDQPDGAFVSTPEVNPNSVSGLQSWGSVQQVTGNQLRTTLGSGNGGLRFGFGPRFNWASGATATAITTAGGFTVAFDWTESSDSDRWVAWKVGTPDSDSTDLVSPMDFSVRLDNDGEIATFDHSIGTRDSVPDGTVAGNTHSVLLTYLFSSFTAGSTVSTTVRVNGTDYLPQTFTWQETDIMRMEFATTGNDSLINNLVIATIPEPSSAAMVLGGVGMLCLLRRRKQG